MDAVIVDPEQVADVLEAAADYIDEHGWCQGRAGAYPEQRDGTACISGAIKVVALAKGESHYHNIYTAAVKVELGQEPWLWNDTPGREQWEVDELLRTTAKRVRAGDITVGR